MIFLIGGHKCGTTFFHRALCKHSKIKEGAKKEIEYYSYLYHNGFNWYKKQVNNIDSSTGYILFPHCAYRIKKDFPDAYIIALLRNPVDRASSHYWQKVAEGKEKLPFEKAIKFEPKRSTLGSYYYYSYLSRGLYADQLPVWMDLFKKVKILKSEDVWEDPKKHLNETFDFLDLKREKIDVNKIWKRERWYRGMKTKTRCWLNDFFRLPNKRLYELCGIKWG